MKKILKGLGMTALLVLFAAVIGSVIHVSAPTVAGGPPVTRTALAVIADAIIPTASAEMVSWERAKRADDNVSEFDPNGWLCDARTYSGKTDCQHPAQATCVCCVGLNANKSAWMNVGSIAAALGGEVIAPGDSSHKGKGCSGSADWWYLNNKR